MARVDSGVTAMTTAHKISPENPPQFPCWLWCCNGFFATNNGKSAPGWFMPKEYNFWRAVYHSSHWHSAQPIPPAVMPDNLMPDYSHSEPDKPLMSRNKNGGTWISCNDKTPRNGQKVLAKYAGVYSGRLVTFWRDDVNTHFGNPATLESQPATHWRPVK